MSVERHLGHKSGRNSRQTFRNLDDRHGSQNRALG